VELFGTVCNVVAYLIWPNSAKRLSGNFVLKECCCKHCFFLTYDIVVIYIDLIVMVYLARY
jgi:hypothetical protein